MAVTPSQYDIFSSLHTALTAVLGVEVIKLPSNNLPRPTGDYATMTPLMIVRAGTNVTTDAATTRTDGYYADTQIQLDFYGATSADMAAKIALLFRSDLLFSYGLSPMFAGEPRQIPFLTGEKALIQRWSMDVHLGGWYALDTPQLTANTLATHTITEVSTL